MRFGRRRQDQCGGGVGHLTDHFRDLVRRTVVQDPAEQRRVPAPRQHDGDLRALLRGLAVHEFYRRAGEPAVRRAVVEFLEPYRTASGGYEMTNVFRYVIGTPEEGTR